MAKKRMDKGQGRRPNVVKARKTQGQMRSFYVLLAAVAVIGLAAIIWQSKRAPKPTITLLENVEPGDAHGYFLGDSAAPVTIMEFGDFECSACGNWATVQEPDVRSRLIEAGIANMRYFDFPLAMHPNTIQASNAAACAADQGKFWGMHDKLFAGQPEWSGPQRPKPAFERYAEELGLDMTKWNECYENSTFMPRIRANREEGKRYGVTGTPTFVIGKRVVPYAVPFDELKAIVDSTIAEAGASGTAAAPADSGTGSSP
jgi:protein-disulfide isomerase